MTHNPKPVLLTADGYTMDRKMRLVPIEATEDQAIAFFDAETPHVREFVSASIAAAPSPDPAVFNHPDCGQCANRGHVNGLSQESYCSHCIHSEKWRKDYFVRDGSGVTK